MSRARYIMIGGFLGAGKTTCVAALAQHITKTGCTVGLITNDQGRELVDTAMLRAKGFATEEIPGGCFCCRFNSLVDAANKLTEQSRPDVFIAEPVGSCTDLVATVTYPLRRIYGEDFSIAPLSVLIDPIRAARIFGLSEGGQFSEKVIYIYRKQLEEGGYRGRFGRRVNTPGHGRGNIFWSIDPAQVRIKELGQVRRINCDVLREGKSNRRQARIGPGDSVLVQGTGGVSMFAIQLAKTVGAHTIVTSSSDRKLAQACQFGADKGINYSSNSDWDTTVKKMTGGEGVDLVIENAGTLRKSVQATRWGGLVAVIGALASFGPSDQLPDTSLPNLLKSGVTVSPIMMGNRRMLTRMVRTYATHQIVPVIDKRFAFREAPAAYDALAAAEHIGKIVITD